MQTLEKFYLSNRLYIEQVICHLFMLVISESSFKDLKVELRLFGNAFQWELVSYGNQSIDLHCKSFVWFPCNPSFCVEVRHVECGDFSR